MPHDDQERFEDYGDLEDYIEALQAGKAAHPRANLTPEQVGTYQMAAFFSSASDDDAEPDPAFAERLKQQLFGRPEVVPSVPNEAVSVFVPNEVPLYAKTAQPSAPVQAKAKAKRARFFSRRGLLTGGVVAAASLVVGAGAGIVYEEQAIDKTQHGPDLSAKSHLQIASGTPTTWHFVTALADLGNDAVRFSSDTLVGYVLRTSTDATNTPDNVVALSGSCTHMGCLVQWKNTERHFACPCHGALFGEQGAQIPTNYKYSLSPLPRLNTKIENGNVYVEVPL